MTRIILLVMLLISTIHFSATSTLINKEYFLNDLDHIQKSFSIQQKTDSIQLLRTQMIAAIRKKVKSESKIQWVLSISQSSDILPTHCLPSIAVAQACLETGYGEHISGDNNIFGIKGNGEYFQTTEYIGDSLYTISDSFRNFQSSNDSFIAYSNIMKSYMIRTNSYVEYAILVKQNRYATDPKYSKKIIKIINKCKLYHLDIIRQLRKEINPLGM